MDPYGEKAPLVNIQTFTDWIVQEDDDLLVVNKPGWLVCHPSKNGPLSSLVGVVRAQGSSQGPALLENRLPRVLGEGP